MNHNNPTPEEARPGDASTVHADATPTGAHETAGAAVDETAVDGETRRWPQADPETFDAVCKAGAEVGIEVQTAYDKNGNGYLVYGYYQNAPVAVSLRTGLVGGLSIAFYTGAEPQDDTTHPGEDNDQGNDDEEKRVDEWDEVLDTNFSGPEIAVQLAGYALKQWGQTHAKTYQGIKFPK